MTAKVAPTPLSYKCPQCSGQAYAIPGPNRQSTVRVSHKPGCDISRQADDLRNGRRPWQQDLARPIGINDIEPITYAKIRGTK